MDAELGRTCLGRLLARLGHRLDVDPERCRPLGDAEPDRAETDDPQSRAEQPGRLAVRRLVPLAGAQVRDVVGDPPVDGEQQPHGQLRHRSGVPTRHVGDQHSPGSGGVRVDGVGAGSRADHQREPVRGLEHVPGDLGTAHHEHVEPQDAVHEVRLLQAGVDDALMAARLEVVDGALRERVGNEDAQSSIDPLLVAVCGHRNPPANEPPTVGRSGHASPCLVGRDYPAAVSQSTAYGGRWNAS